MATFHASMGFCKAWLLSLAVVGLLLTVSWGATLVHPPPETVEIEERTPFETSQLTEQFAVSNGFSHTNLTYSPATGLTQLQRPPVTWTATSGMGLSEMRTGACSAYLPATNEVYLIGGRVDVDPAQTGDEANTKTVEVFDVANKTWTPAVNQLQEAQQYHKCAVIDDIIYAIGDHHPFSSPAIEATGVVQVLNTSGGNWSYGTNMPGNQSVGLAGVASQDGMIYVAGGVTASDRSDSTNRLLRYDPANDTWTQMADMNHRRHSFELVSFRGKLIAYGGVAVYFDPVQNRTVEQETNLTEAYDPITDSWTALPNATHKFSAYAATVFNDEIIIHGGYEASGWSGSANDKTYGYDPFVNRWTTRATLPIGLYDSTLSLANDTLVLAGGDMSNSRFSTWSVQYLAANEYHVNPTSREGLLTSAIQDLRPSNEGAASLLWFDYAAVQPPGTTIGMQYRFADSPQGIASAAWLPTTVPVNSYYPPGNHSLTSIPEETPYLQYRIKYATTRLMEWVNPVLVNVSVGADSAAFVTPPPTSMQPTSSPVSIITQHHAATAEGDYVLALHPADASGGFDGGSNWLTLTWNATTSQLTIDDPDALLFDQQATATPGPMTEDGQEVNWTFSLGGNLPTDHVRFKTETHAERNASHVHTETSTIDRNVSVVLESIRSNITGQHGVVLEGGDVLPGNTEFNISLDHRFTNSGLRLLGGAIQTRIHLDLLLYEEDASGNRIWANQTSSWFDLPPGETYHARLNAPEAQSGELHVWIEARTNEDWVLQVDNTPTVFILNGEGPTLLDVSPGLGEYINEDEYRTVSFRFHDVGGFSNNSLSAFTWLEARDDGHHGGLADGVPQRVEYQPAMFYTHQDGNLWTLNITVNDTVNADKQRGFVLLEGTDAAGFSVPAAAPEDGHARWVSRTPEKAQLTSLSPTENLLNDTLMRFEPSKKIGWRLTVVDQNGLNDISKVLLTLGNDEGLGWRYTPLDNTCASIDERLLVETSDCLAVVDADVLTIDFRATVQWSMTLAGLIQGEVDVLLQDVDGTQRYARSEAWVLDREMSIEVTNFRDNTGAVQHDIVMGAVVKGGDQLDLTATVRYRSSQTPYTGDLRLRWDGLLQGEPWRGGTTVVIQDGDLQASISAPERTGLVQDLSLSLWDPLETEMLATYSLPSFQLDNNPPELMPSALQGTVSRYKLEAVEVGVNIAEDHRWSMPLTLTCQVRSLSTNWEPITLIRNSTTVFSGKTMFTFLFDFSQQGDPSTLSEQATINCWAEGSDDAGWALVSSTGNSELDPWLESPLNNIGPDLRLENVDVSGTYEEGENIRLSFLVTNSGDFLPTSFNTTIELVSGEKRTVVGQAVFSSMEANTAQSVKRSFTAPAGSWTIEITVDKEGAVWELDESNNQWNQTFSSASNGFGAQTVLVGGVGLIAALAVGLLLRKRRPESNDVDKIVVALEATGQTNTTPKPSQAPTSAKRRGPPGGKIAAASKKKPSKGPPRGPPKSKPAPLTPQEQAAKYMDALGGNSPAPNHVEDYSKLPGGGEYEYTAEGTYYVGPTCGRWKLNEDKSFTQIDEEP